MKKGLKVFLIGLLGFFLLGVSFLFFAGANNLVTFEANVMGTDSYTMIAVKPDFVSFGSLSRGEEEREKLCINNTGTEGVLIVPSLDRNYVGRIFDYVNIKQFGESESDFKPIGQFNFSLSSGALNKCIWFSLNLTNYPYQIYDDMIKHQVNVTIKAIPIL